MKEAELLGEVEDILRTKPGDLGPTDNNLAWLGRAAAAIEAWNITNKPRVLFALHEAQSTMSMKSLDGKNAILVLLHQARHDLRMRTIGPVNVAVGQGNVFDYFDEVRKIIEAATKDLLFIDPYLNADFVSRYLAHITAGVIVRLLTGELLLSTLLPAVDMYSKQCHRAVQVRSSSRFHNHYLIVDQAYCYQSSASFIDGAKTAPTTLTQITDAFAAVRFTYEDIWDRAKVER